MNKTATYKPDPVSKTSPTNKTSRKLVINYLTLRKYIGILGIGLPVILVIGLAILTNSIGIFQDAISSYYYTPMRNLFVGILVAVGVFLLTYKGYEKKDNILSGLAGFFAFLIAFIPVSSTNSVQETVHLFSAAVFFIILAYFSYFLFTKSNQQNPSPSKIRRIYRICAIIMISSILAVPLLSALLDEVYYQLNITFWLLWAFGFSWLTKGEAIFADAV
jgi:hypothetical protein